MFPPASSTRLPATPAARLLAHCRDAFLTTLRQAAAEVLRDRGCLDRFAEAAGVGFDEFAGLVAGRGFEQARGLTASRISLVHEADMEYSIELMNLAQRLRDFCARELTVLSLRLRTLLLGVGLVPQGESPVGIESVCRALRGLSEREDLTPQEALALLAQLEAPLRRHLVHFYGDLERQLAQALKEIPSAPPPRPEPPDWASSPAASSSLPLHPVDALRQALVARRAVLPQTAASVDPTLAAVLVERLDTWLGERQRFGEGLPAALGTSELGALLAPAQAVAVEVVETVCAHVLADPQLPATIRKLLAQLRVPLLRLALRSDTLLGIRPHSALRLVDLLSNLGRTLAPDCSPELPICRGLAALVGSLGKTGRPSDREFDEALERAEALLAARRSAALARAAACAEEAAQIERREVALHQASSAIARLLGADTQPVVRDFIEGFWVHVLAKEAYRHGVDSPQWAGRLQTARRLLGCPAAGLATAARQALGAELEAGLMRIGLGPAHIAEGLGPCRALLVGQAGAAAPRRRPPSLPSLGPAGRTAHLRVLKHKQHLAEEAFLPAAWGELDEGARVAIALPDGSVMRGFVALIGPLQHLLLIADADGDEVLAITGRALARQVRVAGSRLFADESLVEHAAMEALLNP